MTKRDEGKLPKWAQERLSIARERATHIRLLALRNVKVTFGGSTDLFDCINLNNGDTVDIDMSARLD